MVQIPGWTTTLNFMSVLSPFAFTSKMQFSVCAVLAGSATIQVLPGTPYLSWYSWGVWHRQVLTSPLWGLCWSRATPPPPLLWGGTSAASPPACHEQSEMCEHKKCEWHQASPTVCCYVALIQTHERLKRKPTIYYEKTQHANFQGKPFFQATKQHLNNS